MKTAAASPLGNTPEANGPESSSEDKFGDCASASRRQQKIISLGVCLFLAIATWLVFGQTLRHEFINFDDDQYVVENPNINHGLTAKGIAWVFTHSHSFNWHPLTSISHMLDCQLHGLKAGGHHLTNVLLHTVTAILLFLVLKQMTSAFWRSAFVAVVFAIHPLRVESVAWVAERKDVLSGVFFMLTIGAYVRYVRQPKLFSRYLVVLLLFALGLMSKPTLVTLPFVLLLLDYWPLNRWSADGSAKLIHNAEGWRIPQRLVLEKLPLFGLCIASCVATVLAQQEGIRAFAKLPFASRLGNAVVSYVTYLGQMVYPVKLSVLYPHSMRHLPFWEVALAFTLLIAISAAVFGFRRKRPYLLVGWLWYLGMLIPMIGIIQVGTQAHADRYTYLSQIGLYLALAWGLSDLAASWRSRRLVLGFVGAVVMVALLVCAAKQTSYWRNSESLWSHALVCTVRNSVAENHLGSAFLETGRTDEAVASWQRAVEIDPNYADAHYNLGIAFFKAGRMDEAIARWQRAIELDPNYAEAHYNLGYGLVTRGRMDEAIAHLQKAAAINPSNADAHYNLGHAFFKTGRTVEAIAQWEKAVAANPNHADAHNNLGSALFAMGRMNEAIAHLQKAIAIKPASADAHNNLGKALVQVGRMDEAINRFKQAIAINPDHADTHYNLGNVLFATGRTDEARAHWQRTVEIDPNRADAHSNLGLALFATGRMEEAITHWQKAVEISPEFLGARNNLAWVLATGPVASLRNGAKAVALAEKTDQFAGGKNPELLATLAAAYAEAGQFPNAVAATQRALQLATEQNNQALTARLRRELDLYQSGHPCRDAGQTVVPAAKSQ